jgi:hypothetical protein
MWALAVSIYTACKWLTWQAAPAGTAPGWKHTAYLLAWPGLDATGFLEEEARPGAACPIAELCAAAGRLTLGVALLFGVARIVPSEDPYLAGWIGMIGIVLMLHFGVFHLLSCGWRRAGVHARPLMDHPLSSTSLGEFWGRRWNTAFRDLTHQFLFRPLTSVFGPRWAIVAGFLFSGAVHDVVISVPARGGYGRPTIFFAIQGAAMVIERSEFGRQIGLGRGLRGRLFTMVVLIAPVGFLFHRPFVVGIVVPFMRALGAIQ